MTQAERPSPLATRASSLRKVAAIEPAEAPGISGRVVVDSDLRHAMCQRSATSRLWRLWLLAVTIAPIVRWVVIYCSIPACHEWQRTCHECGTPLGVDNWCPLMPTSRCGHCHQFVGAPQWSIEVALVIVVLVCIRVPPWVIPAYVWWAVLSVALCFIDVAVRRLPDRLTWLAAGGFLLLAAPAAWHGYGGTWIRALLAAATVAGVMGVCSLLWPHWIGLGDAKFGAAIGAAAGWSSWFSVYVAAFVATLLSVIAGVVLIAMRRASRRSHLPFGPFMFIGVLLVLVVQHG